jgi:hypothetical protein
LEDQLAFRKWIPGPRNAASDVARAKAETDAGSRKIPRTLGQGKQASRAQIWRLFTYLFGTMSVGKRPFGKTPFGIATFGINDVWYEQCLI